MKKSWKKASFIAGGVVGSVLAAVGGHRLGDFAYEGMASYDKGSREAQAAEYIEQVANIEDPVVIEIAGKSGELITARVLFGEDFRNCSVQYEAALYDSSRVDIVSFDMGSCALVGTRG